MASLFVGAEEAAKWDGSVATEFASSFMNVGLFGCTKNAVIKNLNIAQMVATDGLTSTSYFNVGTLIGKAIEICSMI